MKSFGVSQRAVGHIFRWTSRVLGDDAYDIKLTVSAADPNLHNVKEETRAREHAGSYTTTEACLLVLNWDNTYSAINKKTIEYTLTVEEGSHVASWNRRIIHIVTRPK